MSRVSRERQMDGDKVVRNSGGRKQMVSREITDRHGRMSLAVVGIDRKKSRIFIKA